MTQNGDSNLPEGNVWWSIEFKISGNQTARVSLEESRDPARSYIQNSIADQLLPMLLEHPIAGTWSRLIRGVFRKLLRPALV